MSLQDLGAIGEVVGAVAVVVSLIYVAHQIRENSRHVRASMYYATNDAFYRWFAVLAGHPDLSELWLRAARGETLEPDEQMRLGSVAAMLFLAYENNYEQLKLGAIERDTLSLARSDITRLLSQPALQLWWQRRAPSTLTPEFRRAVEAMLPGQEERGVPSA